jgi:hypothetical protein
MAWIVRVETGKGKNKSISQSIPLPNKSRVRAWAKRHPMIKSNTKVTIKNTTTKKTITTTGTGSYIFGN